MTSRIVGKRSADVVRNSVVRAAGTRAPAQSPPNAGVFSSLLAQRQFAASNFGIDALNRPDAVSNFRTAATTRRPTWLPRVCGARLSRLAERAWELSFEGKRWFDLVRDLTAQPRLNVIPQRTGVGGDHLDPGGGWSAPAKLVTTATEVACASADLPANPTVPSTSR